MEKTIKIGSATVTIQRPELTPEERKHREAEIIRRLKAFNEAREAGRP